MTTHKFDPPQDITNLKQERLWDITWARQTFPTHDFDFYLLEKLESGYRVHAWATDATEAFDLRKRLIAEGVCQKPFIRAKQRPAPVVTITDYDDDDGAYDFYKDKWAEGVGVEDIPRHLRQGYLAFCRDRRSAR